MAQGAAAASSCSAGILDLAGCSRLLAILVSLLLVVVFRGPTFSIALGQQFFFRDQGVVNVRQHQGDLSLYRHRTLRDRGSVKRSPGTSVASQKLLGRRRAVSARDIVGKALR